METGNISQQRRKRDRWLESWAPEIVASLISLASVAAIFGCLLAWQGEPIFEWHRVTPNTVVAILATVARIFNGISVSSALGQFKWIWHHQKARPLHDFALIIGATTGPWDSLKLLVRTRSLSIMALGCWITLLVLTFDTFVQQIVAFDTKTEYRTTSNSIPFATSWNGGEAVGTDLIATATENGRTPRRSSEMRLELGFPMQGAIIVGLSANDTQLSQQIPASCSTGNCKWENYQSLAVCSQCNDLGDLLVKQEKVDATMANFVPMLNFNSVRNDTLTEWSLPNGLRLNNHNKFPPRDFEYAGTSVMTAQVGFSPDQTISLQDISTMLLSVSLLKADKLPDNGSSYADWADIPVSATECGLYLCVQEINTTMVNGTLHDNSRVVSSRRVPESYQWLSEQYSELGWPKQTELFNDTFWAPRSDLQLAPPDDSSASLNTLSNISIPQDSLDSLIFHLNRTFDDGALAPLNNASAIEELVGITGIVVTAADGTTSTGGVPYLYSPSTLSTLWLADDIPTRFANLAKSMTNSMRTTRRAASTDANTSPDLSTAPDTVSSLEGFQITTLAVRWEWLALPAACVVLGCVFLLMAVIQTRRHNVPLWKAKALASVLHGFERVPSTDPFDGARITQMERFAKGTLVTLVDRPEGRGWFLEQVPGGVVASGSDQELLVRKVGTDKAYVSSHETEYRPDWEHGHRRAAEPRQR